MPGIVLLYGLVALGIGLLAANVVGRLSAPPTRARVLRFGGTIAALNLGGLAIYALGLVTPPGPVAVVVACAYLVSALLLSVGALGAAGRVGSGLRRLGYVVILLLTSIPSVMVLPLAVLVPFAGLALVEDQPRPAS